VRLQELEESVTTWCAEEKGTAHSEQVHVLAPHSPAPWHENKPGGALLLASPPAASTRSVKEGARLSDEKP
jgi:hypothetical protein